MTNFIVAAVLLLILGIAVGYIVKEKKKGTICVGCPHAGTCAGKHKDTSECGCL